MILDTLVIFEIKILKKDNGTQAKSSTEKRQFDTRIG